MLTLVAANIEEESERERCRIERVNNAIISHISRRGGGAAVANEFRRRRAPPAGMYASSVPLDAPLQAPNVTLRIIQLGRQHAAAAESL